ncbi:MAG: class I SAM-dependent methyltransferase [Candidatus Promineifilaceae bacterium]
MIKRAFNLLLRQPQRVPGLLRMHAGIQYTNWLKRRLDLDAERARLLAFLQAQTGVDAAALLEAHHASEFKQTYRARKAALDDVARGSSSDFDIEALYLAVRCFRPKTVFETGVLYGASSCHILQALHENGDGQLISIDLPSKPNEPAQSYFVSGTLSKRWSLHVGDSKDLLPQLAAQHAPIDFFHHDSLHTYEYMQWEYGTAAAQFAPRAILTSHDVMLRPRRPNPFIDFCAGKAVEKGVFRNLGVAIGAWR